MDTIDSYILKIKQVASLLNYGEPESLELFKDTLPSKLYWILFPINNLREAIDTTKRVLNNEKLDKQLMGQASNTSPFMKLRDTTHSDQKVLIKPHDLENMTSMMYNMSLQKEEEEDKENIIIETDQEIMIDRDKILYKIGTETIIEGIDICKILVETTAETEVGEILIETIVVVVDQEKEAHLQEGVVIGNMVILD